MPEGTDSESLSSDESQLAVRGGLRATGIGIVTNVVLGALKLVVGLWAGSQALVADAFHTISDLVTDIATWLGLAWGRAPSDERHPFGHGRIETLATLVVGLILAGTGLWIAFSAVRSAFVGERSVPGLAAVGVAALSIGLKEWLYRYTLTSNKRLASSVLLGNAWHHRSDALSSIAVLIGTGAGYIRPSWAIFDPLAALFVAAFVVQIGARITRTAAVEIVDTAPSPEILHSIRRCALQPEGVHSVHDIKARTSGGKIMIEIHVEVDPTLSVSKGHAIAKEVETCLVKEIQDVRNVIVHVDPDPGKP